MLRVRHNSHEQRFQHLQGLAHGEVISQRRVEYSTFWVRMRTQSDRNAFD